MPTDSQKARRAEGEQLLGCARDAIRVDHSKTRRVAGPSSMFSAIAAIDGEYFRVGGHVYTGRAPAMSRPTESCRTIVAIPKNPADGWGVMHFEPKTGNSVIEWYDRRPD